MSNKALLAVLGLVVMTVAVKSAEDSRLMPYYPDIPRTTSMEFKEPTRKEPTGQEILIIQGPDWIPRLQLSIEESGIAPVCNDKTGLDVVSPFSGPHRLRASLAAGPFSISYMEQNSMRRGYKAPVSRNRFLIIFRNNGTDGKPASRMYQLKVYNPREAATLRGILQFFEGTDYSLIQAQLPVCQN